MKYDVFDEDYYERGVQTKKSGYQNYSWMPELTLRMAHYMIQNLNIKDNDKVLEQGCAKGFLIKALRILGIEAYGFDVSKYSIQNLDNAVKDFCKYSPQGDIPDFKDKFDWIISKDVMEHLTDEDIEKFLKQAAMISNKIFVVVPLGDNGSYRISSYHDDITHIQIHDEKGWANIFNQNGWNVNKFSNSMVGIKENWQKACTNGNGFFFLTKQ